MVLRVLGALALGVSGWVHLRIALDRPPPTADGALTLSGLFAAQAAVCAVVVLAVLGRGSRAAWTAFLVVAAASVVALVASVYVRVPAIGPLPAMYEPLWYGDKYVAAGSAAVAVVVALAALAARGRPRRR
ncbi:hypothetical protein [Cellulomonas marina]|uniref:Uncharacterized protein n=1 Tax=Cellulomonas marina TaxID=988821 RepID=A0A1I0VY74_9CELL|nr:hypothetical protein [Cellulomonas marina]SFA80853.1 hypothetical protein SAMN05421867_10219 [Cellulomonas marina]